MFRALGHQEIVCGIAFSGVLFESSLSAHRGFLVARQNNYRRCGFDSVQEPAHRQRYWCLLGVRIVPRAAGNVKSCKWITAEWAVEMKSG